MPVTKKTKSKPMRSKSSRRRSKSMSSKSSRRRSKSMSSKSSRRRSKSMSSKSSRNKRRSKRKMKGGKRYDLAYNQIEIQVGNSLPYSAHAFNFVMKRTKDVTINEGYNYNIIYNRSLLVIHTSLPHHKVRHITYNDKDVYTLILTVYISDDVKRQIKTIFENHGTIRDSFPKAIDIRHMLKKSTTLPVNCHIIYVSNIFYSRTAPVVFTKNIQNKDYKSFLYDIKANVQGEKRFEFPSNKKYKFTLIFKNETVQQIIFKENGETEELDELIYTIREPNTYIRFYKNNTWREKTFTDS